VTVRIDQPSVAMNDMMKRSQIRFAFNPHSSPNKWFDIQELDAQGIGPFSLN
jgi:hypothetical protein